MKKINWPIVLAGGLVGLAAVLLTALGNPVNMGFCIACFLRDIAGSVGMHGDAVVQYFRPEIVGLVLGRRESNPRLELGKLPFYH